MQKIKEIDWQWITAIILLLAISRFIPHPPNFTPLAAMAILSGSLFKSVRMGLAIPLAAMLISDLVIGLHNSMFYVYLAIALIVLGCHLFLTRLHLISVTTAVLLSTAVFFLLSNFGAWLSHDMYPQTMMGLMLAYVAGLPFLLNSLLANIAFTSLAISALYYLSPRTPATSH